MKLSFTTQISPEVRAEFEAVAAAGHMDATKYAAVIIGEIASLRPEYALRVFDRIPIEWKKRGPGRPPSGPKRTDTTTARPELPREHVG